MKFNKQDQSFIESLAPTETGRDLLRLLKNVETYYADIRNIDSGELPVRKDALKILREALINKLEVLSGEIDPPEDNWK